MSASRIVKKKKYAYLVISLLSCLVLIPATAGATEPNIGQRGEEGCKYEWWGISRPDLNPNGNYSYYVKKETYNHDDPEHDPNIPKIKDVIGWHNTNNNKPGYDTSANSHMVTIGGNVNLRNVYGGYSSNGSACNNVAIVNSGIISGNVAGGYAHATATANGNKVFIYGGQFTGDADKTAVSGGQGKIANKNMVVVYGGSFANEISGGVIMNSGGSATDNTVIIAGNFSGTPGLYGGNVGDSTYTNYDIVTGNTLYLSGANSATKVQNFETINIGKILNDQGNPVNVTAKWGTPVLKMTGTGLEENKTTVEALKKAKIDASVLTFENLEAIANGDVMNLLECTNTGTINATLLATTTAKQEYTVTPVTGMTINAAFQGRLALTDTALTCTAENKATKLSFGDVEWKNSGALLNHATTLSTISFSEASVDTSNINFTNINNLAAGKKMTLVNDFLATGEAYTGTITGTKYKVGTSLEGKGEASLTDADGDGKADDLVFTALTQTAQAQTHNAVMGAEVGMAALSMGNDFIGTATEGLALAANTGSDGISSFAKAGGAAIQQETGSHVNVHTWNAILGIGHQNKKKSGTFEYGAFFEYGTGNYTTYADNNMRGDGSTRYTGGGLLAKYTMKNNVYVEGSLRGGSIHDDARNVMSDGMGNPYSYDTNAPYFGFHIGVGREFEMNNGHSLDVYGKYFFNRKNGVSFEAGGHYDLDAVTSSILCVGARYKVKHDKWNFYGGLAYEHELNGKATGTADDIPIRAAETKGGSIRAELGATMLPHDGSPWKIDLNVSGFAGKKQGFSGGVSVTWMF
ncbi:Outer membrane autotransporter barrel domain protein [Anaerovibrio sp. JC8]|uniref:autotransporter outer membrane beta-barrel domain-containing protein n=1 Tax=Anaerovibrio sp. JC8 TaxID=1240085 RepID=UPI000A0D22D8|nr:autotransporter outer membrane beta-barrel domain-containing protein [Anaerovibrio sp. JC8]ORT98848.1 Outer membrane autotransporter barrel domain protein [Anaerovibrio sp. JC8]